MLNHYDLAEIQSLRLDWVRAMNAVSGATTGVGSGAVVFVLFSLHPNSISVEVIQKARITGMILGDVIQLHLGAFRRM